MVNQEEFINRLQTIMEYYSINASYLADYINVPRSSISHILSQRNKPSLDLVLKITEKFSEVNLEWLVLGKGEFPNPKEKEIISKKEYKQPELPLFEENPYQLPEKQEDTKSKQEEITSKKQIKKIIFFFEDNSFEIFQN
ncbi:MAG: helix-turn-helix domain-containing protein [Capnocytophaga sp.]|nr:helix-turn-helix domain-containing protein [Capnocytophaga sp.]